MVDETSCVMRHEEEIRLVRIVCAARASQEPIVQGDFHAPLIVLAEGRAAGQLLQRGVLVRLVHIDPETWLGSTMRSSAETSGPHRFWRRAVGPPRPDAAPVFVAQAEGVP